MPAISRGFRGRRRDDVGPSRIPPGQYHERGFPVLSAGPTPRTPLEEWTFSIQSAADEARSGTWDCVTKCSKLDTRWKGVSVDTLLDGIETEAYWVTAFADAGYTTKLGLEDLTDGRAWIAYEYDGAPLAAEHGGLARLLVPHRWVKSSSGCVTDGCGRTSATSQPSTMTSRPSTRPSGSAGRRSSAFVRERHTPHRGTKETTDRGDNSHESDRGDGPGCGNGRDDAGGAARAASSDQRRRGSGSCVGIRPD